MNSQNEELKALNDFLSDIDILKPLEARSSEINFFDVLKISRMEIRHSNMLAWLLDPNENHGLGDKVIKGFITLAARYKKEQNSSFDLSRAEEMDHSSFALFREWCYIDILAVSQSEKFVLCIENKIDSDEHGNQLELYAKRVNQTYHDYQKLFVYLSPDGRESSDKKLWLSMRYEDILNVIESALSDSAVSPEAKLIIENYLKTVRRDIMGSDEVKELCAAIYQKHKKAIDLIIENRPDTLMLIRDIVFRWAKEKAKENKIIFDRNMPKMNSIRYIRFQTEYMSRLLPDAQDAESAWHTNSYYYYEIVNVNGHELTIQLAVNSDNIPEDLRNASDRIEKHFPSPKRSDNWRYRYPMRTATYPLPDDLSESEIFRLLDLMLKDVFVFEEKLKQKLSEQ